eukprot:CAMPEP_0119053430 /NCGR_PEP_ID=MMETSP1177-20130426/74426_1 /TAXON_ID=2985 /ORGANISM="Ochromonas sp, Strain CCMP1899" /LENGTH=589 /DNA_ID=CAMNT_0007033385 /DNA_START=46 /DNA_END=1815 /DNA_ORIENTATION=-
MTEMEVPTLKRNVEENNMQTLPAPVPWLVIDQGSSKKARTCSNSSASVDADEDMAVTAEAAGSSSSSDNIHMNNLDINNYIDQIHRSDNEFNSNYGDESGVNPMAPIQMTDIDNTFVSFLPYACESSSASIPISSPSEPSSVSGLAYGSYSSGPSYEYGSSSIPVSLAYIPTSISESSGSSSSGAYASSSIPGSSAGSGFLSGSSSPVSGSSLYASRIPSTVSTTGPGNSSVSGKSSVSVSGNSSLPIRTVESGPLSGESKWQWEKRALLKYKELHRNLLVKCAFEVPWNRDWPEEMWGIRLGRLVHRIRGLQTHKDKKEELLTMGFHYDSQKRDYGWEKVKLGLQKYMDIYGDLLVQCKFIVPSEGTPESGVWPEGTHDMKIGKLVHDIRHKACYREKESELLELGFVFEKRKNSKLGGGEVKMEKINSYLFDDIKIAYERYKEIKGDLLVRRYWNIPRNDIIWPESTWGMRLGAITFAIRNKKLHENHREELLHIGFEFDVPVTASTTYGFMKIKSALERYKELKNDLRVPFKFITPLNDPDWPENISGIRLGSIVHDIRKEDSHLKHKDELLAMGFIYKIKTRKEE